MTDRNKQEQIEESKDIIKKLQENHNKTIQELDRRYWQLVRQENQLNDPHAIVPCIYKSFEDYKEEYSDIAERSKFRNKKQAYLAYISKTPEFQHFHKIVRV